MNTQINPAFAAAFATAIAKDEDSMKAEDVLFINAGVATPVPFNANWGNGTGYLNGAVNDMELNKRYPAGTVLSSTCPGGRTILIVTTPVGNVVVFQRYSDRTDIIVSNIPEGVRMMFEDAGHAQLSKEEARLFLGLPRVEDSKYISCANIGKRLKGLLALAARIKDGEDINVS